MNLKQNILGSCEMAFIFFLNVSKDAALGCGFGWYSCLMATLPVQFSEYS